MVVGGVWLVLSAFASLPALVSSFAEVASRSDREAGDLLKQFFVVYVPSGLLGVVLGSLPGVYAIASSDKWAARLVPDYDADLELRPSLILAVGAMLLGLSTGVSGAISLAASGAGFVLQSVGGTTGEVLAGLMLERSLYGAFTLIAGILLFRWGSRAVLRAT